MFLVGVIAQDGECRGYGRHKHDVSDASGRRRMEVLCQSIGRKNGGEHWDQQVLEDIDTVAVLAKEAEKSRVEDPSEQIATT